MWGSCPSCRPDTSNYNLIKSGVEKHFFFFVNMGTAGEPSSPAELPSFLPSGGATDLEAGPLGGVLLVVRHGLQHLLVAVGHQADGAQDLQHRHLGLDVGRAQALRDGVDALRVGQHVGAPLGVVHQRLDAADHRGVHAALRRLVVHAAQEVQQAGEAVQLDEARDEPGREGRTGGGG